MIPVRDYVQTIKREWVSECVREWVSEWVRAWVSEWVSQWVSVYVMTIFISSLVVDCVNVNVNVRAYVLQVG